MARLDDRLRRDLERAVRPADPSGVYEGLIRRRERRRIARKVQAGALAFVVIAGTAAGVYGLSRVFLGSSEISGDADSKPSNGIIVFSRDIRGEGEQLFAALPDGSDVRQLTPDGRAAYRSPDVSPNGRTVVVAHEIPSFEAGQAVLATVPIEGGSPTWLTEEPWVVRDPAWSPDGGRIAFAGSPGGPFGIYVFDVMTGDVQLVRGTDRISVGHPTWSPDGSRIAFEASTDADTNPDQTWDIYSVGRDGLNMTNLSKTPDVSEIQPAWSWVNNRIAFVETGPAEGALLTMSSIGTQVMSVYSGEFAPANPVWSPDGTTIAFEAGSEGIFTVRTNGNALAALPGASGEPAWQPIPEGTTTPAPTPTPVMSPNPEAGRDIGLGFRLCDVSSMSGIDFLGDGTLGSAWTGIPVRDGGFCPKLATPAEGYGVAVDFTGDGTADDWSRTIDYCMACGPWDATDINGDGTEELIVVGQLWSVPDYGVYVVTGNPADGSARLERVRVAAPGHPEAGYEPGAFLTLSAGGDAGISDYISCEGYPDSPVLTQVNSFHPPDGPGSETRTVSITSFVFESGGQARVVGAETFEQPTDQPVPYANQDGKACGVDFNPWS
ncbi:MAG TPA: hypothetical protein VK977_05080 [Actinomycetota bacterium]|nr:hypothetical protein [Actinomycetota bacterium]